MLDADVEIRAQTAKLRFVDPITGEYLLMTDLERRTRRGDLAWLGNERQALTVRARYPHTRTMRLERVRPHNNINRG